MTMSSIVDYALPLIHIEQLTRKIHDLCLSSNFSAAVEMTQEMIVEVRILQASILIMEERKVAAANKHVPKM